VFLPGAIAGLDRSTPRRQDKKEGAEPMAFDAIGGQRLVKSSTGAYA